VAKKNSGEYKKIYGIKLKIKRVKISKLSLC
jgi:hypothetical protein